jgi:hypothetical protein
MPLVLVPVLMPVLMPVLSAEKWPRQMDTKQPASGVRGAKHVIRSFSWWSFPTAGINAGAGADASVSGWQELSISASVLWCYSVIASPYL